MKKLILIGGGLLLISLLTGGQTLKINRLLSQMQIKLIGIKKIKINWQLLTLSAKIDLRLTNPTANIIALSGLGIIKITKIAFIHRDTRQKITEVLTNITGISINPNSSIVINDIDAVLPVKEIKNISLFTGDKKKLITQLTFNVLGKEYLINSYE